MDKVANYIGRAVLCGVAAVLAAVFTLGAIDLVSTLHEAMIKPNRFYVGMGLGALYSSLLLKTWKAQK